LSPAKLMIVARPRIITASISGGPKSRAKAANGGARVTSRPSEMIAATNEPIAEMASAAPARPCLAIW
jgi:biotin synthase-related radical SAM superfamily protein